MPSLTVRENVALITEIAADPLSPEEALAAVGLGLRMDHFPAQLSDGEKQSVACARMIAACDAAGKSVGGGNGRDGDLSRRVHAFAPDIAATPLELSYAESEALVACLQEVRFAERSQCRQLAQNGPFPAAAPDRQREVEGGRSALVGGAADLEQLVVGLTA